MTRSFRLSKKRREGIAAIYADILDWRERSGKLQSLRNTQGYWETGQAAEVLNLDMNIQCGAQDIGDIILQVLDEQEKKEEKG